jgi:hypothetical protein
VCFLGLLGPDHVPDAFSFLRINLYYFSMPRHRNKSMRPH